MKIRLNIGSTVIAFLVVENSALRNPDDAPIQADERASCKWHHVLGAPPAIAVEDRLKITAEIVEDDA